MYKLAPLAFALLICFGCGDDQFDSKDIPEDVLLDIDQDGSADFRVAYSIQTSGDPIGNYKRVRMNLESIATEQVLVHDTEQPLFLEDSDLIQTQVNLPLYWETTSPSENVSFPIAMIRTEYDEVTWNDSWSVFSFEEKESYLIGVKLVESSTSRLGFLQFSVDTQTGEFILLKAELL
ncbi:hypothetical protein N8482_02300 [Chitinophagales bacterium]|nr:hypothetical protein [Chitinophagales bacterium]